MHINEETRSGGFIPFCFYGYNTQYQNTNTMKSNFIVPLCKSFKETIINGQTCFQMDTNNFENSKQKERDLRQGLFLFLDVNEDRQYLHTTPPTQSRLQKKIMEGNADFGKIFSQSNNLYETTIFLDTVGKK